MMMHNRIKEAVISLKLACGLTHLKGDNEGREGLRQAISVASRRVSLIEKEISKAKNVLNPQEKFVCPVDYPGCTKNCGSYCCGN